jgi:hypothetical protein
MGDDGSRRPSLMQEKTPGEKKPDYPETGKEGGQGDIGKKGGDHGDKGKVGDDVEKKPE